MSRLASPKWASVDYKYIRKVLIVSNNNNNDYKKIIIYILCTCICL